MKPVRPNLGLAKKKPINLMSENEKDNVKITKMMANRLFFCVCVLVCVDEFWM